MENLELDLGLVEYRIPGGGALRFNPADPNLYGRFMDAQKELEALGKGFRKKAKSAKDGAAVLALLQSADRELKALLETVFPGNDFQQALGGVNLLALGGDGRTLAETLMAALEQVLTQGARRFAAEEAERMLSKVES